MDPVVHFEMAYENRQRMSDFYQKTFDWKPIHMPHMDDYVLVQTGETDDKGMIQKPGMINGGFYKKPEDPKAQAPSVVIAVENLEESQKKVTENGGIILDQPMEIPEVGHYFSFQDTEGNRVGVLQPLPMN
ncbi:VOC family protein [Candidatus Peregrinibacteria bacterium]|nr:MAG: VOC family protein [Candidatus Peregrinibacteria bacterium]